MLYIRYSFASRAPEVKRKFSPSYLNCDTYFKRQTRLSKARCTFSYGFSELVNMVGRTVLLVRLGSLTYGKPHGARKKLY